MTPRAARSRGDGTAASDTEVAVVARGAGGDNGTRQRVLDAAIDCIHDRGLYRASSNAIAESAGLTWGVIQYYFGTRERLMLAVMQEAGHRFEQTMTSASITGETLVERIQQFFDVLRSHYGAPEYLAFTQVIVNLTHDPRTSEQARATLHEAGESTSPQLRRLLRSVFEGTGVEDRSLYWSVFHSLRGLALSNLMLEVSEIGTAQERERELREQGGQLCQALALLIEARRTD